MEKRIVIIDGNSLINRAYYAMQRPMITKKGVYTQGVYGFINMLTKIEKDYEPGYIVVTFDKKAPTFRHLEYAEYKAGRKKMPTELAMQLPILKTVLQAMNIKIVEMEGFEADDLIGTLAREGEESGLEPLIITGDKDALQLATDVTKVLITKKGISEFEIFDKQAMIDKYGFTPSQFIDFKGLMGDSSDNIPGLPGVGEKTAQKLLLEYGSVENIINSTESMPKNKLREKIEDNAHLAVMSKRLATINTHVPIDINFDEYLFEAPNYEELIKIYVELEFNSFLKKIKTNLKEQNIATENITSSNNDMPQKVREQVKLSNLSDTENFLNSLGEGEEVAFKIFSDANHKTTSSVDGICIMSSKKLAYISCNSYGEIIHSVFRTIVNKRLKLYGHYLINDYFVMLSELYTQPETYSDLLEENRVQDNLFNTSFDCAIAQYVLEPTKSNYDLKTLALELLQVEMESFDEFISSNGQMSLLEDMSEKYFDYAKKWATIIDDIRFIQEEKLKNEELDKIFYEVELPLIEPMASMEARGFKLDKQELSSAGEILSKQIDELTAKIYEYAGEEFNINSPIQLGPILFEKLGLPAGKKTKRGYSTSADILEKIKDEHEIVPCLLEYRSLTKLKGTYIDGLLPLVHADGKIHAHFQQTVTATGRISCTEPNLQNIPVKQEMGRKLRKAFIPDDEFTLMGADYSQIELRVLAHLSEEEHLIEAFNNGDDIHKITASRVFNTPFDDVTSLQRSNAKAVNFGVIYGMSGFGLSEELHITRKEAEKYINDYFKTNVKVKEFMDEQIQFCKENGYVSTILGRKRHINEINASNFMVRQLGERLAMNTPIQGSAADIIKVAMIKVYRELNRRGLKSRLILQVHDELIIETHIPEKDEVQTLLKDCMEQAMDLKIKLEVEVNNGNNWYELK